MGLAVEPGALTACQLQWDGSRPQVVRSATFVLPESATLEKPESLGDAFTQFLREQRFTAKRAIIGLPAAWLAVKDRMAPPGDDASTFDILRLLAEQEFATDARELVFDGSLDAAPLHTPSADDPLRAVLLFATLRRRMEGIVKLVEQAGVKPVAVTSTAIAVSDVAAVNDASMLLRVTPTAVELVWRNDGRIGAVRHLSTHGPGASGGDATWGNGLGGELRRVSLTFPAPTGSTKRKLCLVDSAGLSNDAVTALGERLSLQAQVITRLGPLHVQATDGGSTVTPEHAGAAALALRGASDQPLMVNFLHSRLAAPPERMPIYWRYGIAAAILLVVGILALAADMMLTRSEIKQMKVAYAAIETPAQEAEKLRKRVRLARGWYDQRPKLLDCLAALTMSFPERGVVWATNLAIDHNMICSVTGKAENDASVSTVRDAISASPYFTDIKSGGFREADRQSRQVSFSITARYRGDQE